ncbi:MAG: serine/threonine protein kinase [Planctomycetota bacterium]|nr:MAG: serine/threonine protein kinase [Planctomycetota bacterium]REJ89452.1 MAG: serine/threonine protein kinase [Planctomycetota bacterium]REK28977.1 MAG: serine/threonine protein kinase [Planctomycetota bacterium]REK39589.1 MAG: serine/threonine protein kinase [Planctomycetota bacterium]
MRVDRKSAVRFPFRRFRVMRCVAVLLIGGLANTSAAPPTGAAAKLLAANTTEAGDEPATPDWPNFRNGAHLRGIASSDLPDDLELLWAVPTPDGVTATAAIVDGRVYLGVLHGEVLCLDLEDGSEIWSYRSIESTDPKQFAPGFNAPATVSETAVYIGDEDGVVHAVDRDSGAKRWIFQTNGEIKGGVTLLPDGRVMVGSHDGHLYCLDAGTGEEVWACETFGPVNGSQAMDGQFTFVTGCDKPVLRVVDVEAGKQEKEVPLEGLLIASPALMNDVLYFGTPDGEVFALAWQEEQTVWTWSDPRRGQEIHSTPAVTDELVLIGSGDKRLHAIDRETGEERWNFETRGAVDSSPVVVGDRVFFGSADRTLYGVSIEDGSERFRYGAGQRITASPAVGYGRLVIGTEGRDGRILCFGAKQ